MNNIEQAIKRINEAASKVLASGTASDHEDSLADALRDVSYALTELHEHYNAALSGCNVAGEETVADEGGFTGQTLFFENGYGVMLTPIQKDVVEFHRLIRDGDGWKTILKSEHPGIPFGVRWVEGVEDLSRLMLEMAALPAVAREDSK